jgi:hypothetical protein
MNTTTIITIAIAILAVLGLGGVLTASRRADIKEVGSLSRETRKRDRNAAKVARNSTRDGFLDDPTLADRQVNQSDRSQITN